MRSYQPKKMGFSAFRTSHIAVYKCYQITQMQSPLYHSDNLGRKKNNASFFTIKRILYKGIIHVSWTTSCQNGYSIQFMYAICQLLTPFEILHVYCVKSKLTLELYT